MLTKVVLNNHKNNLVLATLILIALLAGGYYMINRPAYNEHSAINNEAFSMGGRAVVYCQNMNSGGVPYCEKLLPKGCWMNTTCVNVNDKNCGMSTPPGPC